MFDPRTSRWNPALFYPKTFEYDVENPPHERVAALEALVNQLIENGIPGEPGTGEPGTGRPIEDLLDDNNPTSTNTTFSAAAIMAAINAAKQSLIDAAPETLNTLDELAAALGDDPHFATTILNLLAGKAPLTHTHSISQIINLQAALNGKAPTVHTHSVNDIDALQPSLDSKAEKEHSHTTAQITDLDEALSGKAPTDHDHKIDNVIGLQDELDGKAPIAHGHSIEDTLDLQQALDAKAPISHTHSIANVIGLNNALDAKASIVDLGTAAFRNVGAVEGTVAAGDDVRITGALARGGGVMTGRLTLSADPTSNMHAVTKQYADMLVTGVMRFKTDIDCSTNPDYPAATAGDAYIASTGGRIGGVDGPLVDAGDLIVCRANTTAGNHAAVGAAWFVLEHNLAGAVLAGNNLSDIPNKVTARKNLGVEIGKDVLAYSPKMQALADVAVDADRLIYATSTTAFAASPLTEKGRTFLAAADQAAQHTALGLGTAATFAVGQSGNTLGRLDTANTVSALWTFNSGIAITGTGASPLAIARTGATINCTLSLALDSGTIYYGNADGSSFAVGSSANLNSPGARWLHSTATTTTVPGLTTPNAQITGGSITGLTALGVSSTAAVPISVNRSNAGFSLFRFNRADLGRFDFGINDTAEGGSNAGSDFIIRRFSDTGTAFGTPITIKRSTGDVSFERHILPSGNNVSELGSSALYYLAGYITTLNAGQANANNLTVINGTSTTRVRINAVTGQVARVQFGHSSAAADDRWYLDMTADTESGSAAGSALTLTPRNDDGTNNGGALLRFSRSRLIEFGSNILPFTSNVYSLGSGTNTMAGVYVADDAYAPAWDGSFAVPTKNAVYDKIEALLAAQANKDGYRFDSLLAPSGMTFARASTAKYRDANGVLQDALNNVPRFTYRWNGTAWVPGGLMMEPASTNFSLYSDDFSQTAYWLTSNISITANSGPNHLGNTGMTLLTAATTNPVFRHNVANTITAGSVITGSVYIKAGPAGNPAPFLLITLGSSNGGGNGGRFWVNTTTGALGNSAAIGSGWTVAGTTTTDVGNGIFRVSITMVTTVDTTAWFRVVPVANNGSTSAAVGYTWYMDGIQLEEGWKATSYIRTTSAAVTRAAESATLDWSRPRYKPAKADLRYTFSDGTTQTVLGVEMVNGIQSVPVSLNGSTIKYIADVSAVT